MTGEAYPGEWENLAKLARLDRERRLSAGWHGRGWSDPASLLRELDANRADPAEVRELAAARQRAAYARRDEVTDGDSALRWLAEHTVTHLGPA